MENLRFSSLVYASQGKNNDASLSSCIRAHLGTNNTIQGKSNASHSSALVKKNTMNKNYYLKSHINMILGLSFLLYYVATNKHNLIMPILTDITIAIMKT